MRTSRRTARQLLLIVCTAALLLAAAGIPAHARFIANVYFVPQAPTIGIGQTATLTATTDVAISNSYFLRIIDETNHIWRDCAPGAQTCTWTASASFSTTSRFSAHLDRLPDYGIIATTPPQFVTWADTGWRVSMQEIGAGGGYPYGLATANSDVGPSQYWLQVYDVFTGARVCYTAWGTTCEAHANRTTLVAIIGLWSETLPIDGIQANSFSTNISEPIH